MSEQIGAAEAAVVAKNSREDIKKAFGSQNLINNRIRTGSRPREMVTGSSFQGLRPHHNLVPSRGLQSVYGSAYIPSQGDMMESLKKKDKVIEKMSQKLKSQDKKSAEET